MPATDSACDGHLWLPNILSPDHRKLVFIGVRIDPFGLDRKLLSLVKRDRPYIFLINVQR